MTDERMREILADFIGDGGHLTAASGGQYVRYSPLGDGSITLDGAFDADELEALAQWMRQHEAQP